MSNSHFFASPYRYELESLTREALRDMSDRFIEDPYSACCLTKASEDVDTQNPILCGEADYSLSFDHT